MNFNPYLVPHKKNQLEMDHILQCKTYTYKTFRRKLGGNLGEKHLGKGCV